MEFGSVDVRIHVQPGEERTTDQLVERLCAFAGFDLAAFREENPGKPIRTNRFELSITTAEGLVGTIRIISARISAKRDARLLFEKLVGSIDAEDYAFLEETVDSRVDADGHFFARLDKPLFLNKVYKLVDHGNCVRFDFNVLTYPKSREATVTFVEDTLAAR